eukprot:1274706-Rhodomonas_salina.1
MHLWHAPQSFVSLPFTVATTGSCVWWVPWKVVCVATKSGLELLVVHLAFLVRECGKAARTVRVRARATGMVPGATMDRVVVSRVRISRITHALRPNPRYDYSCTRTHTHTHATPTRTTTG